MLIRWGLAFWVVFFLLVGSPHRHAAAYPLELKNDGWSDGDVAGCLGGFVAGEEAAITLGPVGSPYTVQKISFLFCGNTDTVNVAVKVYEDTGGPDPGTLLYEETYWITGSLDYMAECDISAWNIVISDGGSVRVALGVQHDGYPGPARDDDGTINPGVNWIKDVNGNWHDSQSLGLTGDWIIRATVDVHTTEPDGGVDGSVAGDGGLSSDGGDAATDPDAGIECTYPSDCPEGNTCQDHRCVSSGQKNGGCGCTAARDCAPRLFLVLVLFALLLWKRSSANTSR